MNKLYLSLLLLCNMSIYAQEIKNPAINARPLDIAVSSGIDNTVGICGVSVEKRIRQRMSLEAGVGRSLWWGEKICIGTKFYFSSRKNPWVFSTGLTLNTGLKNVDLSYSHHGIYSAEYVDLLPLVAVYCGISKYWRLTPAIRIFLEMGGSLRVPTEKYSDINKVDFYSNLIQANPIFPTPGGPMLAMGCSFCLSKRYKQK